MLQSIGPLVERGAVAAVGEGAEIRTFCVGAGIVEVGVAGRVGNDVGHRDAEIVMYGVGHGVAVHVLAVGVMAGNDDGEGAEIRTFCVGAGIVEVGVAGRVGNDV